MIDKIKTGSNITRLPLEFYTRTDVVGIARELLGKVLVTQFEGRRSAVLITETEAYQAPEDRASHAYGNRLTPRTEVMFRQGGCAYVYLCYGIHHLFNVVTGISGMAHAVLIRAGEPLEGEDLMQDRRKITTNGKLRSRVQLTTGPGTMAQALGLKTEWSGQLLYGDSTPVWIEDRQIEIQEHQIASGPRIGVEYAGESAAWPWRFWVKNSPFVKK